MKTLSLSFKWRFTFDLGNQFHVVTAGSFDEAKKILLSRINAGNSFTLADVECIEEYRKYMPIDSLPNLYEILYPHLIIKPTN